MLSVSECLLHAVMKHYIVQNLRHTELSLSCAQAQDWATLDWGCEASNKLASKGYVLEPYKSNHKDAQTKKLRLLVCCYQY